MRDSGRSPRNKPFVDNKKVHVSEETGHKSELRDKLEYKLDISPEIDSIAGFNKHSKRHMNDSNDNGYFHFQTIHEIQIVFSYGPHRVKSKRVYAILSDFRDNFGGNCCGRMIARPKNVQTDGHEIIVDPTAVHGKESHQSDQVAVWK